MTSNDTPEVLDLLHDYTNGTVIEGTEKNSTAHHILSDHRSWMWRGGEKRWGIRSSKRQKPKTGIIEHTVRLLTEAGYRVEQQIDPTMPGVEQQEQDLADQYDQVTDRHRARATRDQAAGQAKIDKADEFYQHLPFGQPILVGHHSEKRDRNRRERESKRLHDGHALQDRARQSAAAAESSAAHIGARYSPETVGNRITKLEAQERAVLLALDGGKPNWHTREDGTHYFGTRKPSDQRAAELQADLEEVREHLAYWRTVRAEHIASGRVVNPADIERGDWVRMWADDWVPVRRVSKKSVTVPNPNYRNWSLERPRDPETGKLVPEGTVTIQFHQLSGHAKADNPPPEVRALIQFKQADQQQ